MEKRKEPFPICNESPDVPNSVKHPCKERPIDDVELVNKAANETMRREGCVISLWKGQEDAFAVSMSNGVLPVFAKDVTASGQKIYAAMSYKQFYEYLCVKEDERFLYELLLLHGCHLFFDVEAEYEPNPGIKEMVPELRRDLIAYIRKLLANLKIVKDDDHLPQTQVLLLDSSNNAKMSYHIIVKLPPDENGRRPHFKNLFHCGAFMRRLRNLIQETEGIDPAANRFFAWKWIDGNLERDFICDSIYTIHRVYRPPYATKFVKKNELPRPFIPISEEGIPLYGGLNEMTWQQYAQYFVQSDWSPAVSIVQCLEIDSSEPRSTNDKTLFRLDLGFCLTSSLSLDPSICISTSASANTSTSTNTKQIQQPLPKNVYIDRAPIRAYYETQFPFERVWELIGAPNREFSFVANPGHLMRFQYFASATSFREAVLRILPLRIDLGAIYTKRLKAGEAAGNVDKYVESRPLTFDLDLDSYSDIRACCGSAKTCCARCKPLANVARVVLFHYLHREYGIPADAIHFFNSGGRGMHVWVLHKSKSKVDRTQTLTSFQREKIAERILGGKNSPNHLKEIAKQFRKSDLREICANLGIAKQTLRTEMLACLWPRLDLAPTTGLSHLMRCFFSYRHDTQTHVSPFE